MAITRAEAVGETKKERESREPDSIRRGGRTETGKGVPWRQRAHRSSSAIGAKGGSQ